MLGEMRYITINLVCTLLRMFPWPCATGLVPIGSPGRNAPVFLTGNYLLTVERVKRALRGMDCYLLVANSHGINVWCAATGGLLTSHDVITALKVSAIGERVEHRRVVLPQLAATGVEARLVRERAGWQVIWGPVRAQEILAFVAAHFHAVPSMREVTFGLLERIEMATAWAFLLSAFAALFLLPWWRAGIAPVVALIWALAAVVYMPFPLYGRSLGPRAGEGRWRRWFWRRGGYQIALWSACTLGSLALLWSSGDLAWGTSVKWGIAIALVVVGLTVDLPGTTPVLKSGLHTERALQVQIDPSACRGDGICAAVCPRGCIVLDRSEHVAFVARGDRCVRCGACVVQCPHDALSLVGPQGKVITADIARRYKLDLMGERTRGSPR